MKKIYKKRIFPYLPKNTDYESLQIDYESVKFITPPKTASAISKIIASYAKEPEKMTVMDCCAGVGGDTIALSRMFNRVLAVEIDVFRYNCLNNNINVYKIENVNTINCNSINLPHIKEDINVYYVDPPWGGSTYKLLAKMDLYVDKISIDDFVKQKFMLMPTKLVAVKVPQNFDMAKYMENIKNFDIDNKKIKVFIHCLDKMNLIINILAI